MQRIDKNQLPSKEIISMICQDIAHDQLSTRILSYKKDFIQLFQEYENSAIQGTTFQLQKYDYSKRKNIDPMVIGDIKHSELTSLYSDNFVPKKMRSRFIYDEIMASANEECPYCGGIGVPKQLDHYLPKSKYPQFSILTSNLVPSCMDCNMGEKGVGLASIYEEQVIHPYHDFNHFFNEKWIDAVFNLDVNENLERVSYFVSPPQDWQEKDKKRAFHHFQEFGLAKRYSLQVGSEYVTLIKSIKDLQTIINNEQIISMVIQHVISEIPNPNNWRRVLYEAVKRDLS